MKVRLLSVGVFLLFMITACAQKVVFQASPAVPAAEAKAKINRDANNNAEIDLRVKHLAEPQRLTPPKSTYVVWAETPQGRIVNLGQLTIDEDRDGSFRGITPLHEFRLLVSAEDFSTAGFPGPQVVLRSEMFRVKGKP